MTDDTIIARSAQLIETQVDGEIVAIDIDRGMCFGLNATASRIWELIEQPTAMAALVAQLGAEFDVPEDECRQDIETLLADMVNERLVRVKPEIA